MGASRPVSRRPGVEWSVTKRLLRMGNGKRVWEVDDCDGGYQQPLDNVQPCAARTRSGRTLHARRALTPGTS